MATKRISDMKASTPKARKVNLAKNIVAFSDKLGSAISKIEASVNKVYGEFNNPKKTFTSAQVRKIMVAFGKVEKTLDLYHSKASNTLRSAVAVGIPNDRVASQIEDIAALKGKLAVLSAQGEASIDMAEDEIMEIDDAGFVVDEEVTDAVEMDEVLDGEEDIVESMEDELEEVESAMAAEDDEVASATAENETGQPGDEPPAEIETDEEVTPEPAPIEQNVGEKATAPDADDNSTENIGEQPPAEIETDSDATPEPAPVEQTVGEDEGDDIVESMDGEEDIVESLDGEDEFLSEEMPEFEDPEIDDILSSEILSEDIPMDMEDDDPVEDEVVSSVQAAKIKSSASVKANVLKQDDLLSNIVAEDMAR